MKKINLTEQKEILLELLKYVDEVCRKNNINYTLIGGSLIGAVRHKGFIPWDDDIDIGLLPKEYEKLIKILKSNNSKYRLLDSNNESSYYYPFAKLIHTDTFGYEKGFKKINNYGINLDIFKYNFVPNNKKQEIKFFKKMLKKKRIISRTVCCDSKNDFIRIIKKLFCLINSNKLVKKYILFSEKFNNDYNKNVLNVWPDNNYNKQIIPKRCFDNFIDVKFENMNAMIVKDYDTFLKCVFGDYMKLPPLEERKPHHSLEVYRK